MTPHTDDTIAALASPPGPASRGIIRVSGPRIKDVVSAVFTPKDHVRWESARFPQRHPGAVKLPDVHCPLAVDVLLWPTTRSYTGQPTAELHTIGSPPLLEALLQHLFAHGARPAQRGEFTLRAFLAGRIDLVQAEAVLGVIEATDEQQLSLALDQLGGGISHQIASLHEQLLLHLADLEAGLDFVEEDIEFVSRETLLTHIDEGVKLLTELVAQSNSRMQSTGRNRVVLAGLPNAGKSTLLNALSAEQTAIVSHVAGTTRDYLSVPLDWDGLAIELVDTAGWDDFSNALDEQSISQAADELRDEQWRRADLILWCTAANLSPDEILLDERLRHELGRDANEMIRLITKSDLAEEIQVHDVIVVSAENQTGLDDVKYAVVSRLQSSTESNLMLGSTAARCQASLRGASAALTRARSAAIDLLGDELIAVELREAVDHLGHVAGRVFTDDILDRIFSRFCIGK
ncbi:MAG: tRNA modification GTPase [Planctomycetaceae bacterium]|nr:tRNA modification GTPase [Planctomycetaceae bacterium]